MLLQQQLQTLENQRRLILATESSTRQMLESLKQHLADAEAERDTIIKLLQSQLNAAETQYELQRSRLNSTRKAFELGKFGLDDVRRAEQFVAETEAKIQQLKLLLELYRDLGTDRSPTED